MNAYQSDLHNLQIKLEGKINELFSTRTRNVQADALNLKKFVKEQIANLIYLMVRIGKIKSMSSHLYLNDF